MWERQTIPFKHFWRNNRESTTTALIGKKLVTLKVHRIRNRNILASWIREPQKCGDPSILMHLVKYQLKYKKEKVVGHKT